MEKTNLLDLDLLKFSEDEEVSEDVGAEESEAAEPTEEPEAEVEETGENTGDAEPETQSAEENARYAAIRRRAEEDARRRYESEMGAINQQIAAMCKDVTHPITGQPITNMKDYVDALSTQQRIAREKELEDKGIDPSLIDRMIEQNPVVMEARQVIHNSRAMEADAAIQRDLAEIGKYDPNIKSIQDISELPNFPEMLERVERGATLVEAYKMVNFDNFMQHTNQAARQQAINQMRGKSHLTSQGKGVDTPNDDVEVPAEIMANWKAEGKTEKQIRELYKTVASKLHL